MPQNQSLDFDAIYRGDAALDDGGAVPWNIGEPQPALHELIRSGALTSPVLDAGCGTGVTALAVAEAGLDVVGVDVAPTAIARARTDAERRGLRARFEVADLTAPLEHSPGFATVLDSALLHTFPADTAASYLRIVAAASRPGARLHVLAFSDDVVLPGIHGRGRDELTEMVGRVWTVDTVDASSITVIAPPTVDTRSPRDDQGRLVLPAWLLHAHLPAVV